MGAEKWRGRAFTVGVTAAAEACRLRDAVLRVVRRRPLPGGERVRSGERIAFASGARRLDACWVAAPVEGGPVVLLCHGIGETVEGWAAVQAYLRERGVGSLVFDYSGYGRSTGGIRWESCEEDVEAAYAEVRRRVGEAARVYVLGFSLGSGIAAQAAPRLTPAVAGLILCEAFTSFREAVRATGLPGWAAAAAPLIWDSVAAVRGLRTPVLVVHSDHDRLFPVEMGRRIAGAAGAELVLVRGYGHDGLYRRPEDGYWRRVVEFVRGIES